MWSGNSIMLDTHGMSGAARNIYLSIEIAPAYLPQGMRLRVEDGWRSGGARAHHRRRAKTPRISPRLRIRITTQFARQPTAA